MHFDFHRRTVSTLLVSLGGFLEVSFWSSFATLNCPACWSSDLPKMCLNHKVMRERGGNLCALYCSLYSFSPSSGHPGLDKISERLAVYCL